MKAIPLLLSVLLVGCGTAKQANRDFNNFAATVHHFNFTDYADPLCPYCIKSQRCQVPTCPYLKLSAKQSH